LTFLLFISIVKYIYHTGVTIKQQQLYF